ncbi:hypothetical protein ASE63_18670 [Bosea sp. Root381]|uniref:hypothetical protein n=1 Tax=Bosea sp. Root381 TaxID=1736524 RepID=UPI0006FF57DA|nr:hypothetical protein [Bosea sp. Root381]KRE13492.1 hypothetical protein ASE63_18670 [Bosea sp. Root381]
MSDGAAPAAASHSATFSSDAELGYQRNRTAFAPGAPLLLDEPYRLAHLPLVAPDHPNVIARQDGRYYEMGRHPTVFSLVLPIDAALVAASAALVRLDDELRCASFARKIAWDLLPRRADRLHATLCGTLSTGEAPVIDRATREAIAAIGPFQVELRGLFSGNVNRGRLYLRAYPETRDGPNPLQAIQQAVGRPPSDLYLVGLYNLTDDLDAEETATLAELIARWWGEPLLRFEATALWLLGCRDDLVLDAELTEVLPLHDGPAGPLPRLASVMPEP